MLKYLLEKEFKQFMRNSFMPKLVIFMPCLMMLILPWAANMEIKNVDMVVVDNDRTTLSARLIDKCAASDYFDLRDVVASYDAAMDMIERGRADIILEIPRSFEKDIVRDGLSTVMISVNAVNGTKGGLGSTYLTYIINDFSTDILKEMGAAGISAQPLVVVDLVPMSLYNPKMDYKVFMVPAFMVILMTLICGFLPALNIVSEKEVGTIEQINVTPVRKVTFILSKLIPYWIIGFVILNLCFLIAYWVYDLAPVGLLWVIYFASVVYVLVVSGFGIVISNYSSNMQQAMFVMFFFILIFILLSGLFTPIQSMPSWAQKITYVNPIRYFIEIMRSVYLKGSSLGEISGQIMALFTFGLASNLWAVLSYRKKL